MKISIVAGGAGFIGSNLCARLLQDGRKVVVIDSLMRGSVGYLNFKDNESRITVIQADLACRSEAERAFDRTASLGNIHEVWHLAANSDIPAGIDNADVDIKNTFLTTAEILRCMKTYDIKKLHFASSSAIYGNLGNQPLHEDIGPLVPISNYGAMKLGSEALICAAAESYLEGPCIFRFPNVVGIPATHGVILDFVRKLKINMNYLHVLGDGTQRKAYLHVTDLISAMLFVSSKDTSSSIRIINVGPMDDGVHVSWIADKVIKRISPKAKIIFGTEDRGWIGDVPKFYYSTERIQALGWRPRLGSDMAVLKAINEIAVQEGF